MQRPAWGVRSGFEGWTFITRWERTVVQTLLPDGITLPEERADDPIVFILGGLSSAELLAGAVPLPTPLRSQVMLYCVPVLGGRGGARRLLVLRIYTSDPIVAFLGLCAYGFGHRAASISRDETRFVVRAPFGSELIRVTLEGPEPRWRLARSEVLVDEIREILSLPVIVPHGSTFLGWSWGWDVSSATVRRTSACIDVSALLEHPTLPPPQRANAPALQVRNVGWWASAPASVIA